MDLSHYEKVSLELRAASKDFQRLVDQQIAVFTQEMETHKKLIENLNSMCYYGSIIWIREY